MYPSKLFISNCFTFLFTVNLSFSQFANHEVSTDSAQVVLGDKKVVNILKHTTEKPGLSFLVIHDDENTSVEAAIIFLKNNGGTLTELQYGGLRNIIFTANRKKYIADPNGIFTKHGTQKSLLKYGRLTSETALVQLSRLADAVHKIHATYNQNCLITLHNNTESRFNILSYKNDKQFIKAAAKVYINPANDLDDFVFVTEESFFNFFKSQGLNTVLQNPNCPDDGSLSVWAAHNKMPYINIEVQHNHLKVQYNIMCLVYQLMYNQFCESSF